MAEITRIDPKGFRIHIPERANLRTENTHN